MSSLTLPPNNRSVGNTAHTSDHNLLVNAITTLNVDKVGAEPLTATENDYVAVGDTDATDGYRWDHPGAAVMSRRSTSFGSECFWPESFVVAIGAGPFDGAAFQYTGAGAAVAAGTSTSNHPGVLQFTTGTVATNRSGLAGPLAIADGGGKIRFESVLRLHQLSDGTNTFATYTGLIDTFTSATLVQAACFRYSHTLASGNWQAVTADTTNNPMDTGVLADTNWHHFAIEINANGSTATFFIDGTQVATTSTNMPTGMMRLVPLNTIKSVGVTAVLFSLDMYNVTMGFTSSR